MGPLVNNLDNVIAAIDQMEQQIQANVQDAAGIAEQVGEQIPAPRKLPHSPKKCFAQ